MKPYALGVDLGTTYTAAAVDDGERVEVLPLGNRSASIPSIVLLREDGTVLTGEAAERRAVLEPTRTAREFKRRLGDPVPLLLGGTPYGVEALQAHLLRAVVDQATQERGGPPAVVALSHPANYGPYKLDLVEEIGRLAGLGEIRLIAEPVAAALDYARSERVGVGEAVAVYDLGGGTFDAAVVIRTEDHFELAGTAEGMDRFGGIDLDEAVFGHVRAALGGVIDRLDPEDPSTRAALYRIREDCRLAKEALSADTEVVIPVILPNAQTEVLLSRSEFEDLLRPRLRETLEVLERVVVGAGTSFADLGRVLLVGGSSRIPLVAEMVRQQTGCPVALDANPKHVIPLGAASAAGAGLGPDRRSSAAVAAGVAATTAVSDELPASGPEPVVEGQAATSSSDGSTAGAASAQPAGLDDQAGVDEAPGGGRRPLVLAAAVAAVMVIAVVLFSVLTRSDGDGGSTTTDGTAAATFTFVGLEPATGPALYGSVATSPATEAALIDGTIDVAVLSSIHAAIPANDWTVLDDDRALLEARNFAPLAATGGLENSARAVLDAVSGELIQADFTAMIDSFVNGNADLDEIAVDWLETKGLPGDLETTGPIVVGSGDLAHLEVLAFLYAEALDAAGAQVTLELGLGVQRVGWVEAIDDGRVDIVPTTTGGLLDLFGGDPGSDPELTAEAAAAAAADRGLDLLGYAPAQSQPAYVVSSERAEADGLTTVSDLQEVTDPLVFGGPEDCPEEPWCIPGLESVYGLRFG